ncbi:MAG: hypothetical protein K0M56_11040 [Kaistella sp.]|nr:hypothetical protein [Kaistella sp.]
MKRSLKQFSFMRKALLLIILICCIQCTIGQSVKPDGKTEVKSIIENKMLNIVYRGIRNRLTIYMPNMDSIKVTGRDIHKVGENEYYIAPTLGLTTEILVTGYHNGKQFTDRREFRILNIQKSYVSIHEDYGNVRLSKEELAASKIKIHIPQLVIALSEVESFEYKINKHDWIINEGAEFGHFAKEQILNLTKGDSVVIDKIKLVTDQPNIDRKKSIELKVYIK